jgi:hypothetical protein
MFLTSAVRALQILDLSLCAFAIDDLRRHGPKHQGEVECASGLWSGGEPEEHKQRPVQRHELVVA